VGSDVFNDPHLLLLLHLINIIMQNLTDVSAHFLNLGNLSPQKQELPTKLSVYSLSEVKHA
jgi:hypothetical protein